MVPDLATTIFKHARHNSFNTLEGAPHIHGHGFIPRLVAHLHDGGQTECGKEGRVVDQNFDRTEFFFC